MRTPCCGSSLGRARLSRCAKNSDRSWTPPSCLVRSRTGGETAVRKQKDSDGPEIGGLGAFGVGLDVERHLLAFRERAQARRFDRRRVNEHILGSAFRRDKAKAFCSIEEFHSTGC